jgi:hypothetical protein
VSVEATPSQDHLEFKLVVLSGERTLGYAEAGGGGILYQTPDEVDGWRTRLHFGLPEGDNWALLAPEQAARWVFLEPLATQNLAGSLSSAGRSWHLDQARHSRLEDVTAAVSESNLPPELNVGDTLIARYSASDAANESLPGWIVMLSKPMGVTVPARATAGREIATARPVQFALRQNRPNPFASTTVLEFDLPGSAIVRLEVFDIMGRRVTSLRNAWMPAGSHSISWNGRDANGSPVHPGAYVYRLTAGPYRAERKLVVMP